MKQKSLFGLTTGQIKKTRRCLVLLSCLVFILAGQTGFAQDDDSPTYCTPVTFPNGCAERNINSFIIQNSGISHIDSGCITGTYGDYTSDDTLQGSLHQGEIYKFTVSNSGSGNMRTKIWIDFNGNGDFEDMGELIFASTVASPSTTGTITIPLTAPVSTTRLRVISQFSSLPANSCTPGGSWGETHDYTVEILPPPVCSTPQNLSVDAVSLSSAGLSWTVSDTEGLFEIEWGETGFSQGEGTVVTGITTTSYELTNLEEETFYDYYVRHDCGDDGLSFWSGPYTFYTGYCLVSSTGTGYRITGFTTSEGYTNILNSDNGTDNTYSNYSNYSVIQSQAGSFDYEVSVPGSTNVEIWVDWNNNFLFEEDELVAEHIYEVTNTTFTGTITIPEDTPNGNYRIRVRSRSHLTTVVTPCGNVIAGEAEDYTLSVISVPSCLPPTALAVNGVTYTSADISWTSDGTLFEVQWGENGFALGSGTIQAGITQTFDTLTGLDPETHYQYYVRQDCGEDDLSFWAGPYPLYTGYCLVSSTYTDSRITGFTTWEGFSNIYNPDNGIWSDYSDFTNHSITQSKGGSFDYGVSVPGFTNVEIWVDWNNNFLFEEDELVAAHAYESSDTTITGTITIPEDLPDGDYRFRIRSRNYYWATIAVPCGNIGAGEAEDYTLSVVPVPSCLPPSGLDVELLPLNSAELFWSSEGDNFEVEYGEIGFTPGNGTPITGITTNSQVIEGLMAETFYHCYVRQDCGEEDLSLWTGPHQFYTGYCSASSSWEGYNITSSVITGGLAYDISNITGGSFNGYGNYTGMSVHHFETGTINFTITTTDNMGVNIWIDWNSNMEFEESEKVYTSGVTGSSFSGSFIVPSGTAPGDYRIRVRGQWNNVNPDPCGSVFYGEVEDYTLTVINPPSCMPPTELGVETIMFTSADLFWISEGTDFEVEYGLQGFILGEGTSVAEITANGMTLSGLSPETHYQYYVRRNCGNDDLSPWSGPYLFYTGYCLVSTTTAPTPYRITGFSTTDGYTNIWNPDNGIDNAYNNFTNYVVALSEGGSFSYSVDVPAYTNVEIWIDYNNNILFDEDELIVEHVYDDADTTFTGTITILDDLPEGDYRIRVRSRYYYNTVANPCGAMQYGETEDYTLSVIPVPVADCLLPTGLAVDGVTFTSADVSWISEGTLFNVEVGVPGFTAGNGAGILHSGVSNFYTIEGLDPETHYHYYVQRDCSETEDGESLWAGPYPFYTGYCLVSTTVVATSYHITGFSTSEGYTNIFNSDNGTDNTYSNFSNYTVTSSEGGSFDYSVTVPALTNVKIWVDWNSNMMFDEDELVAEHIYYTTSGTTFIGTITIPEDTPDGDYRLRIRSRDYYSTEVNPCGPLNYGETEDYTIAVVPVPSCLPPSGLDVELLTFNSAELLWIGEGNTFEIEYGESGFTPGNGTSVTGITTNSYIVEGLTAETFYHYYVRQDCGGDDWSLWAGPYQFYTGYCLATSFWEGYNITSFVTTGGVVYDISSITGGSLNGYGDYTNMSVHHFETGSVNFTITTNNYIGVNIWIDWNSNMGFEESEKVFSSGVPANSFSGTILVPLGTPVGDYRIRIRAYHLWNTDLPPCGNINYGEAEDYTFTVITPPSCLLPFVPDSTNISASSVLLEWQADGNLFDIEYGLEGFGQGGAEATIIEGVGNPYTLSNLTPGVTYEYYVRQDCGEENGYSMWNGPTTFKAGVYEGDIPTLYNEEPGVDDETCTPAASFDVEVPEGYYLSALNVQYTMNSYNGTWTSHQRSVLYSPTLGMGESEIFTGGEADFPGSITYNRTVDFANGATGTIEFVLKAWRTTGGTGCNTDYAYVMDGTWVLNPTFELIPTCPNPPTGLGYTSITEDSVDLIWESEEGTLFEVRWGTVGFDPEDEEGTLISAITTTSYTLSGLDSSIAYEFYVRRDCSTGDEEDYGDWAGPFTFNSGYCLPTSQLTQYISAFSTGLAIENISYTSTAINPGGYGNKTDLVVSREPGESFTFSTNFIGGQNAVRIWVDWNDNFLFEEDEEVFSGSNPGPGNLVTGSIAIPAGAVPGNYVMRVRTVYGASASPQPCGEVQYGEALDFTLHIACVIAAPAGETAQVFTQGQTLADLEVTGVGLVWYADSELTDVLNETHELVHGVTYYVVSSNEYCQSEALIITVTDSCFGFAAPAGEANQTFTPGQTLADLDVTGIGLTWYADSELTDVLNETHELVHGATYYVVSSNEYCQSEALMITVTDSCFGFAAPVGEAVQTFTPGQTLADLDVTGIGLTWYAEETLTTVLEESTELVHGVTYYVISSDDDCQSEALAITVTEVVNTTGFDRYAFKYYPNPVSEVLYLTSNTAISEVVVLTMLGQKLNLPVDLQNTRVDMTGLPSGNYFISITIEGINKVFKVIKH